MTDPIHGLEATARLDEPDPGAFGRELDALRDDWYKTTSRRRRERLWNELVAEQPALAHLDPHNLGLHQSNDADVAAMLALISQSAVNPLASTLLIVSTVRYWTRCTQNGRHRTLDVGSVAMAIRHFSRTMSASERKRPLTATYTKARRLGDVHAYKVLVRHPHIPDRLMMTSRVPDGMLLDWTNPNRTESVADLAIGQMAAQELADQVGKLVTPLRWDEIAALLPHPTAIGQPDTRSNETRRREYNRRATQIAHKYGYSVAA